VIGKIISDLLPRAWGGSIPPFTWEYRHKRIDGYPRSNQWGSLQRDDIPMISEPSSRTVGIDTSQGARETVCASSTQTWSLVLKTLAGLASAVALAACVTANVDKDYVLSPASGTGVVVGTITSDGVLADYRLMYRQIGGTVRGFFHLESPDPGLNAALIAAALPAGDYEIYSWAVYWPYFNASPANEVVPAAPFSIPFHVAPGQAAYIGSCAFDLVVHERRGYHEETDAASVVCSDESKRDIAELDRLYPGLRGTVTQSHPGAELYRSDGFITYEMSGTGF